MRNSAARQQEPMMQRSRAAGLRANLEKTYDPKLICHASAEQLADLPAPIRQLALMFDGTQATGEIIAHAQISDDKADAVIRKLTAMGHLRQASRAPSAFSAEEEAFFSAEVGPIDECDEPFVTVGERFRSALCEVMVRLRGQHVLG